MAKQFVDVSTREMKLDAEWPVMNNVESLIMQINQKLREARDSWNAIQTRMLDLKSQGLIYAGTHWKAGVYLYLVYPSKNGEPRKREYIGKDEAKIKEAMEGLERGKEYLALEVQAERLQQQVRIADFHGRTVFSCFR